MGTILRGLCAGTRGLLAPIGGGGAWGSHACAWVLLALIGAGGCVVTRSERPAAEDPAVAPLLALYQRGDFFRLRAALDSLPSASSPTLQLLRAATAQAFNQPARSNGALLELERTERALPGPLRIEVYRLRFRNDLRLYDYAAAAHVARDLIALARLDTAVRRDVENDARIAAVLADVPPQRVLGRAPADVRLLPDGRVPVQIGDSLRAYALDTGANFSVLTRSETEALGLALRPAGVEVGTSTGRRVRADVAVARRVRLAGVELSDVVFLVLPDEALRFGSFSIPGLIGFPVAVALGALEFRRDGVLRIPAEPPAPAEPNLALRNLTPLVRVMVLDQPAVCELDTGAGETVLLQPFFRRFRARIESEGRPDTVRTAGAGGERRIAGYLLRDAGIVVAGRSVTLPRLRVYTESVAMDPTQSADCRLGQDVLRSFPAYVIDFRSMVLRGS